MKITFDDGGHIEFTQSDDKVLVVIQARDATNPLKTTTNAAELTIDQFQELCAAINVS